MAFHISPKTGEPGKCVSADRCLYKEENDEQGIEHFDNKAEANKYYAKPLKKKQEKSILSLPVY